MGSQVEKSGRARRLKLLTTFFAVLLVGGLLAACGGGDSSDSGDDTAATSDSGTSGSVAADFGVEIPEVELNFGMMPFGDHMIYAAGQANGWFEEVGLKLGPSEYASVAFEQAIPLVVNGDFDVTTQWGPTMVQSMASAPNLGIFAFGDTHDGVYVLAPPDTDYETLSQLTEEGVPFEEAMKRVMEQFKGKKFAIDDSGAHRTFVDGLLELGGITANDLGEILTVDDGRMLVLARGGQIDFAKPLGGAQEAELLVEGWYPVIGATDIIAALEPGDPRGVSAIGNTGLMVSKDYFEENKETLLRFAGVMYRTIDAILEDVNNDTDENALAAIQPVLQSTAGVELDMEGLRILYGDVYSFYNFEESAAYWTEPDNPLHFTNVYTPQIEAAQKGGVLPKGQDLKAEDVFGMGQEIYEELVKYKEQYDSLVGEADGLEGDAAKLAEEAAVHYENRNYLDAARFLEAAVNGGSGGN